MDWALFFGGVVALVVVVLILSACFYGLAWAVDRLLFQRRKNVKGESKFARQAITYRMQQFGETEEQARAAVEGRLATIIQETIMKH
jgi:hypothetical protein